MNVLLVLVLGISAGTLSGLLGIGGGVIFVPSIVYFLGAEMKVAVGTSLAIIIPTVISGSLTHYFNQNIEWKIALLMALGAIIGAYFGATLAEIISEVLLKRLFALILIGAAVKMFVETF